MAIAAPQILADLMDSLHRFVMIATYYQAGHAVAGQAAEAFSSTSLESNAMTLMALTYQTL